MLSNPVFGDRHCSTEKVFLFFFLFSFWFLFLGLFRGRGSQLFMVFVVAVPRASCIAAMFDWSSSLPLSLSLPPVGFLSPLLVFCFFFFFFLFIFYWFFFLFLSACSFPHSLSVSLSFSGAQEDQISFCLSCGSSSEIKRKNLKDDFFLLTRFF